MKFQYKISNLNFVDDLSFYYNWLWQIIVFEFCGGPSITTTKTTFIKTENEVYACEVILVNNTEC